MAFAGARGAFAIAAGVLRGSDLCRDVLGRSSRFIPRGVSSVL